MCRCWLRGRDITHVACALFDIIQPVFVSIDLPANGAKEDLLDRLGDRPRLSGPDRTVVGVDDRNDLGSRSGQERFVGEVQVRCDAASSSPTS